MRKAIRTILEAVAVTFAANWFVYLISRLTESSFLLLAWITPVACYVWFRTTHKLANYKYVVRVLYYSVSVVGALTLFGIIQVYVEPPSGWGEIIYLGYLPVCALQLIASSLAAALHPKLSPTGPNIESEHYGREH
jgi:hypothetical protein